MDYKLIEEYKTNYDRIPYDRKPEPNDRPELSILEITVMRNKPDTEHKRDMLIKYLLY